MYRDWDNKIIPKLPAHTAKKILSIAVTLYTKRQEQSNGLRPASSMVTAADHRTTGEITCFADFTCLPVCFQF
jgi:hypothetical protein